MQGGYKRGAYRGQFTVNLMNLDFPVNALMLNVTETRILELLLADNF